MSSKSEVRRADDSADGDRDADGNRTTDLHSDHTPSAAPSKYSSVDVAAIPLELRQIPQWVGRNASSTGPSTWAPFAEAVAACKARGLSGIGLVVTTDDNLVGIDLDGCIGEDGVLADWAAEIVRRLNSYTEVSPSRRGLRLFVRGEWPDDRRNRRDSIEVYGTGRYLTVTGNVWPGAPATVNERQDALDELAKELGTRPACETVAVGELVLDPKATPPLAKHVALLERDPRYRSTWNRSRRDLESTSEYDMSLAHTAMSDGWSDQEVANLLIAFRRRQGDDLAKALRPDYIRRTIGAVRAQREGVGARLLGIEITKVLQYGLENPRYTLVLGDGRRISGLDGASLSYTPLKRALFAAGVLMAPSARKQFHEIERYLLQRVEVREMPSEDELTRDWLMGWLEREPTLIQLDAGSSDIFPSDDGQFPAIDEAGRLYIRIKDYILDDARRRFGQQTTMKLLGIRLRSLGFEKKRFRLVVSGHWGERKRASTRATMWYSPTGFVPEDLVADLFAERREEEQEREDAVKEMEEQLVSDRLGRDAD